MSFLAFYLRFVAIVSFLIWSVGKLTWAVNELKEEKRHSGISGLEPGHKIWVLSLRGDGEPVTPVAGRVVLSGKSLLLLFRSL